MFTDVASGAEADRPQLAAALGYLRPGDVLTVWQLDRPGRSMRHLIDTVKALRDRGVQFRSLRENIDTTTASGRLIFTCSPHWRRKMTPEKIAVARQMYAAQTYTVEQIARTLDVTRGTVYAHLHHTAV